MNALPPDDDRTRMASPAGESWSPTPDTGDHDVNALPAGTRLGEFEIISVIGVGGFSIVYLAYDHSLQRKIAMKEYMPSSLASRGRTSHVTVKSARHADTFQAGMRSFINEARLLARFDHPALLKVYRFWEANGTAYLVMPFYEGRTLTQTLRGRDDRPDEAWLRSLLAPLLIALETIHTEQCFHRDIAPDNIMMLADDRPLLLDFGAARRAIGGMTQAFTVILKPGYAPIEQYAEVVSMQQGAWTDIYALGSVVYFAVTGRPPAPSVARMISDPLVPLAQSAAGRYSDAFLRVIDRMLAVKPEDRPQSIAELRSMLGGQDASPEQRSKIAQPLLRSPRPFAEGKAAVEQRAGTALARTMVIGAVLVLAVGAGSIFVVTRDGAVPSTSSQATPERPVTPPEPSSEKLPPPAAVSTSVPPSAPMPIEVPEPKGGVPASGEVTVAKRKPADPTEVIERIFEARNPDHEVSVSVRNPQVVIGQDRIGFSIRSSRPGYVYLLMTDSDRSKLFLLFPNRRDKNNRIATTTPLDLPRPTWPLDAGDPPGIDRYIAIVSESPRDFREAEETPYGFIATLSLNSASTASWQGGESMPVLAGRAKCAGGRTAACPESYGAEKFSIEVLPRR